MDSEISTFNNNSIPVETCNEVLVSQLAQLDHKAKIYVAGHRGLAGSAVVRALQKFGFNNLVLRTHAELDLTNQQAVAEFFATEKPEYVFLCAAKVGGIYANNTYRGDFIYQNLMIQSNIIHSAYLHQVKRLIFLGSNCIYPKNPIIPITESELMTGELEITNRPYAIAKIAGIEMCWSYNQQYGTKYIALMPTNLFGIGDNYHPQNSHVLPAMIRKAHHCKVTNAKYIDVWGTGTPYREFLSSDQLAEACLFTFSLPNDKYDSLINSYEPPLLNVGTGIDYSIADVVRKVCEVVGFTGELKFDHSKPDGTFRKLLDISKLSKLGWHATRSFEQELTVAYQDYLDNYYNKEQQAQTNNISHDKSIISTTCTSTITTNSNSNDLVTAHIKASNSANLVFTDSNVNISSEIFQVILCGGKGTRLWPLSTGKVPKQFSNFVSTPNLFAQTINRLAEQYHQYLIITNKNYLPLVFKDIDNLDYTNLEILCEPVGRNTAPAVTCAASYIQQKYGDHLILVLPSDHYIKDTKEFLQAVEQVKDYVAHHDVILTFGITPTTPDVKFGYIQKGVQCAKDKGISQDVEIANSSSTNKNTKYPIFEVVKFHEKPDLSTAETYLETGNFLWNSGIFLFKASTYLKLVQQLLPSMAQLATELTNLNKLSLQKLDNKTTLSVLDASFSQFPNQSIDYAILEKASNIVVTPLNINWSDMGSWEAIYTHSHTDSQQNIILGNSYSHNVTNSYVKGEDKPIVALGVSDLVVVDTEEVILVSHKSEIERANALVTELMQEHNNKKLG